MNREQLQLEHLPGVQQGKDCDPTTPRLSVLYPIENQFLGPRQPGLAGDSCTLLHMGG